METQGSCTCPGVGTRPLMGEYRQGAKLAPQGIVTIGHFIEHSLQGRMHAVSQVMTG